MKTSFIVRRAFTDRERARHTARALEIPLSVHSTCDWRIFSLGSRERARPERTPTRASTSTHAPSSALTSSQPPTHARAQGTPPRVSSAPAPGKVQWPPPWSPRCYAPSAGWAAPAAPRPANTPASVSSATPRTTDTARARTMSCRSRATGGSSGASLHVPPCEKHATRKSAPPRKRTPPRVMTPHLARKSGSETVTTSVSQKTFFFP